MKGVKPRDKQKGQRGEEKGGKREVGEMKAGEGGCRGEESGTQEGE